MIDKCCNSILKRGKVYMSVFICQKGTVQIVPCNEYICYPKSLKNNEIGGEWLEV